MNERHLKYEDALMGILHCEGEILPFLDVIFGFLYRRTDFYKIQHSGNEKMGFPPGIAEKIVMTAFTRYLALAKESENACKYTGERKLDNSTASDYAIPPIYEEVEIEGTNEQDNQHSDNSSTVQKENVGDSTRPIRKKNEKTKMSTCSCPLSEMTQTDFQNNAESYNGAIREHYSWSQTLKDLDVRIKVPDTVTGCKQVKVDFGHNYLKVSIIKDDTWETLVDGKLKYKINVEESMWTLVKGEQIFLNLEKVEGRWWDSLLEGEPTIDIQKIDNSQPMEELDSEAQAKIGELFYNEQQKRLGKPTTEQQKIQNILKGAWDKEGSPFKGTPYDPNKINVSNSGQFNPEYQPPT